MNDFIILNETENTPDVDNMRIVFSVLKFQMDGQCAMCKHWLLLLHKRN